MAAILIPLSNTSQIAVLDPEEQDPVTVYLEDS